MGLIQDVADMKASLAALSTVPPSGGLEARLATLEADIVRIDEVLYGPVVQAEQPQPEPAA